MAWDDSDDDDDWEKEDLKLPGGPADEETWSDEEGHDVKKEVAAPIPAAPPPAPPKPKTGLEKKIEEREKREAEAAAAKAAREKALEEDAALKGMDAQTAEKMRRQKLEEAADLDAALDTFGGGGGGGTNKKPAVRPGPVVQAGTFEAFEPKTDAEFEKLAEMMQTKLAPYEGTKGHSLALKALLRAACASMSTDDCKELASLTAVLSNDKIKADREKDKKGKSKGKSKGKLNISSSKGGDDMDDMGDGSGGSTWGGGGGGRDDDFDFM